MAVLAEIGHMLPQFKRYAETGMFDKNDAVKRVMCLFYGDILDLHLEMLKFFSKKGKENYLFHNFTLTNSIPVRTSYDSRITLAKPS